MAIQVFSNETVLTAAQLCEDTEPLNCTRSRVNCLAQGFYVGCKDRVEGGDRRKVWLC